MTGRDVGEFLCEQRVAVYGCRESSQDSISRNSAMDISRNSAMDIKLTDSDNRAAVGICNDCFNTDVDMGSMADISNVRNDRKDLSVSDGPVADVFVAGAAGTESMWRQDGGSDSQSAVVTVLSSGCDVETLCVSDDMKSYVVPCALTTEDGNGCRYDAKMLDCCYADVAHSDCVPPVECADNVKFDAMFRGSGDTVRILSY